MTPVPQVVRKHEDTMFRAEVTAERERQALAERINSGLFAAEDRRFGRIKSVQAKAAAISSRQQVLLRRLERRVTERPSSVVELRGSRLPQPPPLWEPRLGFSLPCCGWTTCHDRHQFVCFRGTLQRTA